MANPRNPFEPRPESIAPIRSEEFDDSIFDRAAQTEEDDGVGTGDAAGDGGTDGAEEQPSRREGLPPGFRMRHDAHYVDELMSGGRPARIVSVRAGARADAPRAESTDAAPRAATPPAYAEIGESLEAIRTCLQLFRETARPPAERVALDLIETEAARAAWLVQALAVLDDEPPVANGSVDLEALARSVTHLLSPGRYGAGAAFRVETSAPGLRARGDQSLLAMSVAAIATALQAATERASGAVVRIQISEELGGRVRLEVMQEALRMPATWRARFLDPEWHDRPGGRRAAIGLAAASRVAGLHRGTLTMGGAEHGGCRLVLSLPRG